VAGTVFVAYRVYRREPKRMRAKRRR